MAQLPPDSQAATASQFTPLSAFAVPVANAIGARASAPAMVASPNVVRMFFTSFLSPSARQQRPQARTQMPVRQRFGSCRLGQARQGERKTSQIGRAHV